MTGLFLPQSLWSCSICWECFSLGDAQIPAWWTPSLPLCLCSSLAFRRVLVTVFNTTTCTNLYPTPAPLFLSSIAFITFYLSPGWLSMCGVEGLSPHTVDSRLHEDVSQAWRIFVEWMNFVPRASEKEPSESGFGRGFFFFFWKREMRQD